MNLNLYTWLYSQICKPTKIVQYINTGSNHPVSMVRGTFNTVSVRLSNLTSNRDIFVQHAPAFKEALNLSVFKRV